MSAIARANLLDPLKLEIAGFILEFFTSIEPSLNNDAQLVTIWKTIEQPPEPELGDFAMPCFRFAKPLKMKPQALAEGLQEHAIKTNCPVIERIDVVGAFCNFIVPKEKIAEACLEEAVTGKLFDKLAQQSLHKDTKVMVEYSQPNTHKEFHVGHGRNVCLGDSICRLHRYSGYQVLGVNYIGDEGTHVAKCLWQIEKSGETLPNENQVEWYGKKYAEATLSLEEGNEDEQNVKRNEVSDVLAALESKNGPLFELWRKTRQDCLVDFNRIYEWLDVHFNHFFYESEVSEESQSIVDEYIKKGLFTESEGAYGIDMSQWKLGYFMARKSDGTSLYITKDLALAAQKFREFQIDRSIYVVGNEQKLHFKQLFKALELMGFKQASQCHHLNYAHVKLPTGKMSSRKGDAITFKKLIDLILKKLEEYLRKYAGKWDPQQIEDTAHKLAVGAVKYGMLSADTNKEIIFDQELWTSFEGNSGPYLMYSYARTQSIIKKCTEAGIEQQNVNLSHLTHTEEHELIRAIYNFNRTVDQSCESQRPSVLCTYLYNLCKSFNRFYANHSVLKAESEETKKARLLLTKSFASCLKKGLHLLGITPPEKM